MSDSIMVANPAAYTPHKQTFTTSFISALEFWQQEKLVKKHDAVLWQAFHTHGKYQRIIQKADWFVVATENKKYLSSAILIEIGDKWLLEYLMTDPVKQGRGAASAVLDRILTEAKRRKILWVVLNCDPKKDEGKLPLFYAKFGFKPI